MEKCFAQAAAASHTYPRPGVRLDERIQLSAEVTASRNAHRNSYHKKEMSHLPHPA